MGISIKDMKPFTYKGGNTTKKDWYAWIVPMAKVVGADYGIPWQAIAVQTALETGWGKSSLLRSNNNFSGIKAVAGQQSVTLSTQEFINGQMVTIKDGFAVWASPYKGLIGYAEFFHKNKRYKTALKFPNDPFRFIEEIKKAGFATDPDYVTKLHGLLKTDFKLKKQ